ncbi:helix-turn-helix transcriptional regulator [Inquilinus sp. Marseille-Q2685]|uniref:helix-turn-helix transcriptional regulator n=1 Tax=Inquilinus sp. Marseille-Q2685 TaxID=2866581 RepID=UPI001CE4535E|nr:helix-turn-helix transcriptional regulator [Inquilinus sp. Marseille-Q2685]
MAGIDSAADLDYSLTMDDGLAAVLSTRAAGVETWTGQNDDKDERDTPTVRSRDDRDDGIEDLLDWLDLGVIIADAAARPIRLNRRAGAIVARADGLYATPFGITTAVPEETARLRQAIAMATTGGARLRLTRPSGSPPLLVTVIPVRPGGDADGRPAAPWVALFVMDPGGASTPSPALLQELFGLTAAEAVFAAEISRGDGLQAVAERLAIAPTTARTHLTRIFEKTGTRRQAELVRLLMQCDRLAPSGGWPPPGRDRGDRAPAFAARISS